MKLKLLIASFFACLPFSAAFAQMTFTLSGMTYSQVAQADGKGFTTVTLPAGTDLSGLITAVEGKSINISAFALAGRLI
jgi:tetrahydromethanopterin S-methyltransferase subunit D